MKQHYKACIYAAIFILLSTAFAVKMRGFGPDKSIPDLPKPLTAHNVKNQPNVAHDTTINSIQQSLAKREYNISLDKESSTLQSPNRKQGLRAYYKPGVLTIKNRVDSAGHNFSLKLVNEGIYADGKKIFSPKAGATLDNSANRLQIKHSGFTEEFINSEEGVRQNFIIDAAPESTRELQVRLSAKGLKVNDLQNNELQFYSENENGEVTNKLVYKDIKCWDADGKTLPATLRFTDNQILLSVNVIDAAYPVTIDPIVINGNPANANATVESNQAAAWMGGSVASAGDINGDGYSDLLVSASKYDNGQVDEGAVFVYNGSASGINAAAPVILESDQKEARFGACVSSAGDINKDGFSDIIVGAHMYDKGQSNEGAAFIYYGSAQGISKAASLVLESNQTEANMGNAVGLAGDVNGDGYSDVVVCARAYTNGQSKEGVAFVYHGSAAGLNVNPMLIEQNQPDAMFGFSAAGAGDVNGDGYSDIMIGARMFDKGEVDEGAVFVYHGSALGINPAAVATTLESNQKDAYLGHTIASAGDVNGDGYSDVIVGANMYDKGQTNEGAAFVHYGSAQGVNVAPAIVLEKNQAEAQMGYSVASAGDVNGDGYADVIVGAMFYDSGQNNEGAAFIYQGSSTGLSATAASTLEGNQAGAQFGSSVASAGDVNGDGYSDVLVGATLYANGQGGEGAAFVWVGGAFDMDLTTSVSLDVSQAASLMAWSVAGAGDVNGDGFDDVIVGAPDYDNGQSDEGVAFLYCGSSKGVNNVASVILESNQTNAALGKSVSTAGDVNGDGYADIVVGVIFYSSGELFEGGAFIYYGSANGIDKNKYSILQSNQANAMMGRSVSTAGDVNADGFGDVIVGAEAFDNGQFNEGAVFLYLGSANGIIQEAQIRIESNQETAYMGYSVANAGDVNSDGFSDVVVGLPFFSNGENWEGAAHIYYGAINGLQSASKYVLQIDQEQANFGWSVAGAGDVNADGYSDFVVGAPQGNNGTGQEGIAFLYYGSSFGPISNNVQALIRDQKDARMGESVSGAGDVNGDGYSDIIIGAPHAYKEIIVNNVKIKKYTGRAYLYAGSGTGIIQHPIASLEVLENNACFGQSVASVGDANSDGYGDIIVGAPYFNGGAGFVAYGNTGICLQNNLRLYNSNLTSPISQTQKAKNNFGAGLFAKSFLGTSKGALVWETRAKGQGFSKGANNSITNSTQSTGKSLFANLGATGTELKSLISKQGSSTKVRVRVRYAPTTALTGQMYGPWRYLPAYLLGNSIAPAPENVVDDMSETVKRKVEVTEAGNASASLYVYPNPASDRVMFKSDRFDQIKSVQMLTIEGKLVYRSLLPISEIDARSLAAGNYILLVTHNDGSTSTRKVVIEK